MTDIWVGDDVTFGFGVRDVRARLAMGLATLGFSVMDIRVRGGIIHKLTLTSPTPSLISVSPKPEYWETPVPRGYRNP